MTTTILLGSVLLIMLPVLKASYPRTFYFLPLGGSAIAEIGIVLGIDLSIAILVDMYVV
jgi:hypothetical protein